jgi:RimJ/RimL family protein N-acetyltransferase
MISYHTVTTERLHLTPYAPDHAEALFAMNADPDVMRYLGGPETREETDADIARVQVRWGAKGYGWWSVFLKDTDTLIGAGCLQHLAQDEDAPLEIGWRFMTAYQGKGYATEAGQAAMDFGFQKVGVDYLCAVANSDNIASQKVMQRLGMHYVGIQTHYGMPCVYYEKHKPSQPTLNVRWSMT